MFRELSEAVRFNSAKAALHALMCWLGEIGLGATLTSPGLLAVLDQHSASVRDALGDPEAGPGAVGLAAYAAGVKDAAAEYGWEPAVFNADDWDEADWPSLRLLSICALARAHGYA